MPRLSNEELEQVHIEVQENKQSQKKKQVRERKAHSISRRIDGPIPREIDQYQFQFQFANEDSESEIDEEKEYSPDDPVFQRKLTKLVEKQYQSAPSSAPSTPQDEESLNAALEKMA